MVLSAAPSHPPTPSSRKGMPTRPHPRAERRLKPDEWSLGTACAPGPYFTPQSLIKTRCGTSWAEAAYSGSEKDICLQWHRGLGGNGAKVTTKVSWIGSCYLSRGFLEKAQTSHIWSQIKYIPSRRAFKFWLRLTLPFKKKIEKSCVL